MVLLLFQAKTAINRIEEGDLVEAKLHFLRNFSVSCESQSEKDKDKEQRRHESIQFVKEESHNQPEPHAKLHTLFPSMQASLSHSLSLGLEGIACSMKISILIFCQHNISAGLKPNSKYTCEHRTKQ